jgi:hypothetical protein
VGIVVEILWFRLWFLSLHGLQTHTRDAVPRVRSQCF